MTFDEQGKVIDEKHVQVAAGGVEDASKNEKVQVLKKKAGKMKMGFRVTRMED